MGRNRTNETSWSEVQRDVHQATQIIGFWSQPFTTLHSFNVWISKEILCWQLNSQSSRTIQSAQAILIGMFPSIDTFTYFSNIITNQYVDYFANPAKQNELKIPIHSLKNTAGMIGHPYINIPWIHSSQRTCILALPVYMSKFLREQSDNLRNLIKELTKTKRWGNN